MLSKTMKTLTIVALVSLTTLPASAASDDHHICFTKLGSTFKLIDLYVKGETVDPFLLDQLDKTNRYCSEVSDPRFSECQAGIDRISDLAKNEGQGAILRAQAIESQAVCSLYLDTQKAPKQPI